MAYREGREGFEPKETRRNRNVNGGVTSESRVGILLLKQVEIAVL